MNLLDLSGQIKTFTERVEDETARDAMRQQIEEAHTVVFLGFAFHRLNMELITPPDSRTIKVFATAYGISSAGVEAIEQDVRKMLCDLPAARHLTKVMIDNKVDCARFFDEYWYNLSRA